MELAKLRVFPLLGPPVQIFYAADGTHRRVFVEDLIPLEVLLPAALSVSSSITASSPTPSSLNSGQGSEDPDFCSAVAERILRWLDANSQPSSPLPKDSQPPDVDQGEDEGNDADALTSGTPFPTNWTSRVRAPWQDPPHEQPLRHQPLSVTIASDATPAQLGISAPGQDIFVLHAGSSIYVKEDLALVIAIIVAPCAALLLCDNQALVHAVRSAHGHALPWPLHAALLYSFLTKDLKIKWVPTYSNPADAPSRASTPLLSPSSRRRCERLSI